MIITQFVVAFIVAQGLHLAAAAAGVAGVGGAIRQVCLGSGPVVFRFRIRGAEVLLRLAPLFGYVQFWTSRDGQVAPDGVPMFDQLPRYRQAAAHLSGPIGLLIAGSALANRLVWRDVLEGAVDYVRGAFAPVSVGADLLAQAVAAARTEAFPVFLGIFFAKIAAWNLLPIPSTNGGAILELALLRGPKPDRIHTVLSTLGFLLGLAGLVSWLVALVTFLRR